MTVRPGSRLIGLLLAIVAWSLFGLFWPAMGWLIPVVLLVAGGFLIVEWQSLQRGLRGITIERQLPPIVARDRPFTIALEVSNAGDRAWSSTIREVAPQTAEPRLWTAAVELPPGQTTVLAPTFRIPVRGRFSFGPTWIRLQGPWRLLEVQKSMGPAECVNVYPESLLSEHELAKDAAAEIRLLDKLRHSRHRGMGSEFESLEEFRGRRPAAN